MGGVVVHVVGGVDVVGAGVGDGVCFLLCVVGTDDVGVGVAVWCWFSWWLW